MISAVIIEDEQHCVDSLMRLLDKFSNQIEVIDHFDNIVSAVEGLDRLHPNLVFMDVELKDGNCFDLLQKVDTTNTNIIFTTAHNEYAIRAFKYSAVHYLLKPIESEQLREAIERCIQKNKDQETRDRLESIIYNLNTHNSQDKKIAVPTTKDICFYKLGEIVRFEGDGNYCTLVLSTGKKLLITKPLKHYESFLDKRHFFRTHRSHLVNLEFVDEYRQNKETFVKLSNGDEIPVSVRRRSDFFNLLAKNNQF